MTSDKDFLYEVIIISSILPLSLAFYQSFKNSMISKVTPPPYHHGKKFLDTGRCNNAAAAKNGFLDPSLADDDWYHQETFTLPILPPIQLDDCGNKIQWS